MTISELRREGASAVSDEALLVFEWNADTHSMTQDTLDLELQVNTVREMPPGAEEPVEQIMSVEWTEVPFHGEWRDQWAGVGFAKRTCEAFAEMASRVPMVRIVLGPWSLVGILKNFKIKWRTDFEIGWSFSLSVHRNETISQARKPQIESLSAADFSQRLLSIRDPLGRIDDTLIAVKEVQSVIEDVFDAEDNLNDLRRSVANAEFAVESSAFGNAKADFLEIVDKTQHKLLAIAAAFSGVRAQAQQSLLDVQEIVSADLMAYDDVVGALHFEEWSRTQYSECVKIISEAKAAEIDARARASRRPRGIHRVKNGDTLERISMKWYGSPDSSIIIMDANNLDSILPPVGVDLIIPDVTR